MCAVHQWCINQQCRELSMGVPVMDTCEGDRGRVDVYGG